MLFFLLFIGFVCGDTTTKQNFRVSLADISACFSSGLCSLEKGCCSGNGVCQVINASAVCVCDAPRECRLGFTHANYSGQYCEIAPSECCTNEAGTDDLIFSKNGGCHLQNRSVLYPDTDPTTNLYPEAGARGNLFLHTGDVLFGDTDGISDSYWTNEQISDMVDNLTDASRGNNLTGNNMLGLGFLEFAIKDIVDYEYNYTNTVTFYNVTYPTLKWQENTGISVGSLKIPKQFANNATAVVDLGPLYDYAHRIPIPGGSSNETGPYLDLTDAFVHWNDTHHAPYEFLVALRYYAQYHYLTARNLEEFFCGQNSTVVDVNWNDCTIRNDLDTNNAPIFATDQALRDWIYEQARRSAIRFSHALLQQSVLPIGVEFFDSQVGHSAFVGKFDPAFYLWFNYDGVDGGIYPIWRDQQYADSNYFLNPKSYRSHQEWNLSTIKTRLAHTVQAGLNPWISFRNTAYRTSTADSLLNPPYDCAGYVASDWAKEIVRLARTPCQRYGSQILEEFKPDIAIELFRAGELGLAPYQTSVSFLTDAPSVSDLGSSPINFLFGTLTEKNPARQLKNTSASTAVASLIEIHWVTFLNVDRTGYWHYNSTYDADGNRFHPDPRFITLPAFDFQRCYQDGFGNCTVVSRNAASLVLGYDPLMDPNPDEDVWGPLENPIEYRSRGLTMPGPNVYMPPFHFPYAVNGNGIIDRTNSIWQLLSSFLAPLFYRYDGLNTISVKETVQFGFSENFYIPNPIVDSMPTNIGWIDEQTDGFCYEAQYFTGDTCRIDNSISTCYWYWG